MRKYFLVTVMVALASGLLVWGISQFVQLALPYAIGLSVVLFLAGLVAVLSLMGNLKDAIEFVRSLFGKKTAPMAPQTPLELRWTGDMATTVEEDFIVLKTSISNAKSYFLTLIIKNTGTEIAPFYHIAFEIPHTLAKPNSESHSVWWIKGDENNWSRGADAEISRHEFKSNGKFELYPEDEVHIATLQLHLYPDIAYPARVHIRHSVAAGNAPPKLGACGIKIRPEDLTHKLK